MTVIRLLLVIIIAGLISTNPSQSQPFHFTDGTEAAGLASFQHVLGSTEKIYIFDTMGSGVCAADINNDGFDDLYFLNAGRLDADPSAPKPKNHLYLNNGDGTFCDITDSSGLACPSWSMSAVFGDVDNDNDVDVYVGNDGKNFLYRNNGDNTFTDITDAAGVGDERLAAGTLMADVDRDGWLDIFVTNYVTVNMELIKAKGTTGDYHGLKVMLGPLSFEPQQHVLYHNNGDGTFSDITVRSGLSTASRGMGGLFSDLDNDGDLDLYLANDSTYNFLYENKGDGTFEEIGIFSGSAVDQDGTEQGSMAVAAGDYNRDGFTDLFVTSFYKEHDTLYHNLGALMFQDVTRRVNMFQASYDMVGWGNAIADFDNDGFDDLIVANGHIYPNIGDLPNESTYEQKNVILHNLAGREFRDETERSGPGFQIKKVSRGLAVSDFDNDGDVDIVVNNLEDTPSLLINQSSPANWLQVDVKIPNRSAIGSKVTVRAGQWKISKEIFGGCGYQSQHSQILHFGLVNEESADVNIHFPDGSSKKLNRVTANQRVTVSP